MVGTMWCRLLLMVVLAVSASALEVGPDGRVTSLGEGEASLRVAWRVMEEGQLQASADVLIAVFESQKEFLPRDERLVMALVQRMRTHAAALPDRGDIQHFVDFLLSPLGEKLAETNLSKAALLLGESRAALKARCVRMAIEGDPPLSDQEPGAVWSGGCLSYLDEVGPGQLLRSYLATGNDGQVRSLLILLLHAGFSLPDSGVLSSRDPDALPAVFLTEEQIEELRLAAEGVRLGVGLARRRAWEDPLLATLERHLDDADFRRSFTRHWVAVAAMQQEAPVVQIPEGGRSERWRKLYSRILGDETQDEGMAKPLREAVATIDKRADAYSQWLAEKALPKTEELLKAVEGEERREYGLRELRKLIERNKEATAYQRLDAWVDFAAWAHDVLEVDVPLGALGLL